MSEQTPLVTPSASRGVRGYPRSTEYYLFDDGGLLVRELPYWLPPREVFIHNDGTREYPGGEAGAAEAARLELLDAAIGAIEEADRGLAGDLRDYFQV